MGPQILTDDAHIIYLIIFTLAIANVVGCIICLMLTKQIAKVSDLKEHYLIPVVFVIVCFAAFQTTRNVGDLMVLAFFSLLGWVMKSASWPRPPLIIAFVLGPLIEKYFFISLNRYGFDWISRPTVIVLFICLLAILFYGFYTGNRDGKQSKEVINP